MPCQYFGTFRRTGDQPNKNPGALFRCTADIFSNITNREIQRPGMLVARKIGQVGLVGCTNDWDNRRSSRKLILRIPPPVTGVHLAVYLATLPVCEAQDVQNRGASEMGDVPKGTVYIGKYPCSIMFRRCANDLQSNYHCRARNRV